MLNVCCGIITIFQGATIRNEGNGVLIIGRILKGSLVERCGMLHEGDELLEVNSIDMRGRTVNDAYEIIVRPFPFP